MAMALRQWSCSLFLFAVTFSCLIGQSRSVGLVFDEAASRVCGGVDSLLSSGNVTDGKQCTVYDPQVCLDFECEYEIEADVSDPIPFKMEVYIEPCAFTQFLNGGEMGISRVHIFVFHEDSGELFVAESLTENSTVVTMQTSNPDLTSGAEIVTIKYNITVIQQPEGIVFGVLLMVLSATGEPLSYVSVYNPILIRIACVPPPPTNSPPSSTNPPPPPTTSTQSTLSDEVVIGIIAGVPAFVLLIMIILVTSLVLVLVCVYRRKKKHSIESNLRHLNREERSTENSRRYTDLKFSGNPMFHHQLPVPMEEEEEEETYDEINIMRPVYGVTSMEWNYVQYNTGRSKKDEAWVYPRSDLTYLRDISQGQYTKVMLMNAKDIAGVEGVMPVVVKALCSDEKLPQRNFDQELQLRKTYHHQNIVSLLGICTDTVGQTMMVLELMDYGNLLHYIKFHGPTKYREAVLDYSDFYNFASDISSALEYLAEKDFVHCGVAAENCLVGRNFMVKLTGFSPAAIGESAPMVEEETLYLTMLADSGPLPTTSAVSASKEEPPSKKAEESEGLLRWKAPETLVYGKSTTKSDIWSFGVLLWELATYGSVPHAEMSTNDVLQSALRGTLQLSLPTDCPEEYSKVFASCQRSNPVDRPSFKEVFDLLSMKANNLVKSEGNSMYEL